ncbi:MAG: cyclophilin-like fold protein [Actinomycetota bacterium]
MPRAFEFVVGNERVVCDLLDAEAPRVAESFVRSLPVDSFSVHAKFAGDELIIMVPFFDDPENEIFWVKPGDIGYYPGRQTICVFYGPTEPFGQVSVFARAREEHLPMLRKWGEEILSQGSLPMVVHMHDPAGPTSGEEALP